MLRRNGNICNVILLLISSPGTIFPASSAARSAARDQHSADQAEES